MKYIRYTVRDDYEMIIMFITFDVREEYSIPYFAVGERERKRLSNQNV